MLRVLAIAPEDGWAYVRWQGQTYLLRPPYFRSLMTPVDEAAVPKAVTTHGFSAWEQDFPDWQGLTEFLNQKVAASREWSTPSGDPSPVGRDFLLVAEPEDLTFFLDQVEAELLPRRQWDHAQNVLLSMLRIPRVREDSAIHERAVRLLSEASRLRREWEKSRDRLLVEAEAQDISPLADKRYGRKNLIEYAQAITQQGSVFALSR